MTAEQLKHLRRVGRTAGVCCYCGDDRENLPDTLEICPVCEAECAHNGPILNGHCRACGERLFPESTLPRYTPRPSYTETHVSTAELENRSPTGCALAAPTAWFDVPELTDDAAAYQKSFEGERSRHDVKLDELDNPLEWNFELYVWQGLERLSGTGRRLRWNR